MSPSSLRFESASRGLRGFLAWWGAGLAAWLPAGWRQALAASSDRLLLQLQGEELHLRRQGGNGLQDIANLPVPPSRGEGMDPLEGVLAQRAAELPRWLLLPAASGLRRSLLLPAAARERLREVLAFEIERQTPFAAGDVFHDGRVLGLRDDGQLQAELVVAPRARADAAIAQLGTLSAWLAGIDLADAEGRPLGVNLLPVAQRHRPLARGGVGRSGHAPTRRPRPPGPTRTAWTCPKARWGCPGRPSPAWPSRTSGRCRPR